MIPEKEFRITITADNRDAIVAMKLYKEINDLLDKYVMHGKIWHTETNIEGVI